MARVMIPCRNVAIVAFPGVQPLDVVGPHEVFAGANKLLDDQAYAITIRATVAGPVLGESGLSLLAEGLTHDPIDTLLIAGGFGVFAARHDEMLVDWIRTTAATARRVASVCTGAFLLAEAGLLNGRTVTTHWARAERLATDYPLVTVDPDPIYIHDGNIWTSAGVTAGMDLALALVGEDHGVDLAQTIARWLVMLRRRSGGQTQFAPAVWTQATDYLPIQAAVEHIQANPNVDLSVQAIARTVGLSSRHFSRMFTEHVGMSPGRFVDQARMDIARHRLEQTTDTVATIANTCGFGTSETMRRTFMRHLRVSPDHYRRHFSTSPLHPTP